MEEWGGEERKDGGVGRCGLGQRTVSACSWTCGSLCRTRFITDPIA